MKGIGLIMLLLGVGLIIHALSASDSLNSAVNSVLAKLAANLPFNRTVWLLIGGSGAVVLGMAMILRRSSRSKGSSPN